MKTRIGLILAIVLILTACTALVTVEATQKVTEAVERPEVITATPTLALAGEVWTYQNMRVGALLVYGWSWVTANTVSYQKTAEELGIPVRIHQLMPEMWQHLQFLRHSVANGEVDVIILTPSEKTGWDEALWEAKDAGIPVIVQAWDIDAPEDLYATQISSDYVEEGRKAGQAMLELLADSEDKNVVELVGNPQSSAAEDRGQGFREAIEDSGIVITQSQIANWSKEEGKAVMQAWLQESRDIQAVFAQNDDMALGTIEAIKNLGLKPGVDIKIVSIDAISAALESMVVGELNVSAECSPDIAPQVYEAALKALNGEELPKWIPTNEGIFDSPAKADAELQRRKDAGMEW